LLLDERFRDNPESQVQTIAHGVLSLEVLQRNYGITRRRLEVLKVRASSFREGYHDYVIVKGGVRVFPRLVSGEHRKHVPAETLPSGIAELDALFNGGVQRGTSTLIAGPPDAANRRCARSLSSAAPREARMARSSRSTRRVSPFASVAADWGSTWIDTSMTKPYTWSRSILPNSRRGSLSIASAGAWKSTNGESWSSTA
jgi:hypothetical protein